MDERRLTELLGPELAEVTEAILAHPKENPYFVQLPEGDQVDLPLEVLGGLVAKSSNNFARIARFAGMARAEAKLCKGRYERKFKRLRTTGRNDAEREANALTECQAEHVAMVNAEAVAEIAESLEAAARIASESSRKLYTSAQQQAIATHREPSGYNF